MSGYYHRKDARVWATIPEEERLPDSFILRAWGGPSPQEIRVRAAIYLSPLVAHCACGVAEVRRYLLLKDMSPLAQRRVWRPCANRPLPGNSRCHMHSTAELPWDRRVMEYLRIVDREFKDG